MKKLLISSVLLIAGLNIKAQTSISFYNLGNATFQNSYYNPAWTPAGKIFIGLPVLSGVHLDLNNKFSYSESFVKEGTAVRPDLDLINENLQKNNLLSGNMEVSLFHFGMTTSSGRTISFYANERIEMDFLYPKNLITLVADGNLALQGETLTLSKTRLSFTHFREYGFGISGPIHNRPLKLGLRVKCLQGFVNISTPHSFQAKFTTDPIDYSFHMSLENARMRTSGLGILQGNTGDASTHFLYNRNRGLAFEIGGEWQLNKYYSFSASILDLGFIAWREDTKNYVLQDTSFNYSGLSLKSPGNLERTLQDSLISKFEDRLSTNKDKYTTMTHPKIFLNWVYHTPIGGDLVASYGARYLQGQIKSLAGIGYRHSFGGILTGSVNVTKLPQQFLNLGAAITVNGGPVQLYLAADQVAGFDLTKTKAFDIRVGINFVIRPKEEEAQIEQNSASGPKSENVSTSSFLGTRIKAKKKTGIYTIIGRQKRRNPKRYNKRPKD